MKLMLPNDILGKRPIVTIQGRKYILYITEWEQSFTPYNNLEPELRIQGKLFPVTEQDLLNLSLEEL